jgi:hypothetical protein
MSQLLAWAEILNFVNKGGFFACTILMMLHSLFPDYHCPTCHMEWCLVAAAHQTVSSLQKIVTKYSSFWGEGGDGGENK